jgi:hypothetical protein
MSRRLTFPRRLFADPLASHGTRAVLRLGETMNAPARFLFCALAILGSVGAARAQGPATSPTYVPAEPTWPLCCTSPCNRCALCDCPVVWLRPWKCEDLEMKPAEPKPKFCGCSHCDNWLQNFLWCVPEEEKKENGNGEKKNGDAKEGDKKNGEGEEKKEEEAEEPETLTPLMQIIQCTHPDLYCKMEDCKTKAYGWIQAGYTFNPDGPNRAQLGPIPNSFLGPHFNNRFNDFMLNQVWVRLEKTLEHGKEFNWGFTVDVNFGQDAADFNVISLGMWDNFNGDADAVIADDEDYGLDIPQFYVECHVPGFITEKGMDLRVGRMLTLHGNELSPAIQTNFYSHSYGYFFSWPLSHTGVMTILHVTDTIDMWNCAVIGWDNVFADNNDNLSYHGMLIWTSCDKRQSAFVTATIGPEGVGIYDSSNHDNRVLVTADYSQKCGCYDEWQLYLHAAHAWDTNIFDGTKVEWYDYAVNLFYTVDPHLILGARAELFRDDDGYRTGFANTYYEVTLGVTCKPYQNLRIRPEIRYDWCTEFPVFNDFQDKQMFTAAVDMIWEF